MPIREKFPEKGTTYQEGISNGNTYTLEFGGVSLAASYAMIREFLKEEGYEDIPLPKDAEELQLFRHAVSSSKQILLFDDNGYCHNPIKILFPLNSRKKNNLYLVIYNENATDHLLRFYNKLDRK